jgi:iron complex outermembrane receptor protein
MRCTVSKAALCATGLWALTAAAAQAQTSSPADAELSEVTVTGSRVIMNGNDAPTPVTVVDVEDMLVTKPTTVFESLADLPQFSGSRGLTGGANNSGLGAASALASLNLRNLGGQRALVLFDGHRVPPTTADGIVNVNMLPQMLLQRVDVVTGGASAVYGSEAVTGVINFIVDRKFNGLKVNLQGGISGYDDDGTYDIGIAGGMDLFGGRGHLEGSYQVHNDAGILHREEAKSKRDWLIPEWTVQGNGTAASPWHLQDNVRINTATFGGLIVCPTAGTTPAACPGRPLIGYTFDDNGVLTPFETGSSAGLTSNTIQIGGDGVYQNWPSLKSANKLDQVFLRFDYDLSDSLHAFISGSGALDYYNGNPSNLRTFGQGYFVGACNAFLSQQYQTALGCTDPNAANPATFRISKLFDGFAPGNPGANVDQYGRSIFFIAGLEGRFGEGYRWEASYTRSQAGLNVRANKLHHQGELFASLDAVIDPATQQIVCRVTLTNPGLYPGCVPLNLFGPTSASAESIDYIFGRLEHRSTNKLDGLSGSIAGAPFRTWAGPVDMALSGEFRRQSYQLESSTLPTDFISCTGLRFGNCVQGTTTVWLNNFANRTPVEQKTAEVAIEFNVPLLKDKPFFDALNLNAAARYTHYDNDPGDDPDLVSRTISATTWKTGLIWDVLDTVTLRWARSRDIRAPDLFDLYTPVASTANSRVIDYLLPGEPVLSPTSQSGGNPFLDPEVAHTSTLGIVWRPTPSFSLAVDAYDITIIGALATINGATEAVQRACYASGGASPLCELQERPGPITDRSAANGITKVYNRRINVAVQKAQGIDLEANWKAQLLDHPFSLRGLVTYQPHLIFSQPPLNENDQAGVGFNDTYGANPAPVWKASLFAHVNVTPRFAVDVSERYRSSMQWSADPSRPFGIGGIDSVFYTNMNLSYSTPTPIGQVNAYLNVQNLFNKDPPPSGNPGQQLNPGLTSNGFAFGDDIVGRYYSLGVRVRF